MFKFMKEAEGRPKQCINGKEIWISSSKSPEERKRAKHLSKFKKVLIELKMAEPTDVRVDYRREIAFVKGLRVAEWTKVGNHETLVLSAEKLKEVGIDVDPEKLMMLSKNSCRSRMRPTMR